MKQTQLERAIKRISRRLFTICVLKRKADRLVLHYQKRDSGGWCRRAVEEIMREELTKIEHSARP